MGGILSYLYHPWCDWGRGETGRGIRGSSNLELIMHGKGSGQPPTPRTEQEVRYEESHTNL